MMQKELDNMIRQFPQSRVKIIDLFNGSEDFKSLCVDYLQCERSLQAFLDHQQEESQVENEYRRLLHDLREDVVRYLGSETVRKA